MQPDDVVVRYEPRGVHRDFMLCRDTEVAAVGRAGSGKTLAALWKIHLAAMQVPNMVGLVLRSTQTSLTSTTLATFQRQVTAHSLAAGEVVWYGGSPKDPPAFRYLKTGSVLLLAGGDRPERFLSLEADRIFIDEAVEVSLDLYETLITRLRGHANTYKQIALATNPSYPQHWIKRRADEGALTMFTSTHRDNPHYMNRDGSLTEAGREYMAKLDKLTGVRAQRLREGRWTAAEGVIYEEFDEGMHVVRPFPIPRDFPLIIGIDFGYSNPMSVIWYRQDNDGRLFAVRELYRTGMLVEDMARDIKRIAEANPDEPAPTAIICDHDAEDRATLERHLGITTTPAKKAVKLGIEAVQQRLRPAGDGKPRFFAFQGMLMDRDQKLVEVGKPTGLIAEIPGYVWEPPTRAGAVKEAPVKLNDHSCDNLRMVIATLDLVPQPKVHSPARASAAGGGGSVWGQRVG